jgi:chemotaxis protein CheZ
MTTSNEDMTLELSAAWSEIYSAVETIMDAAERISAIASGCKNSESLRAAATEILEACSFQDITGQRLAKVAGALSSGQYASGEVPPALSRAITAALTNRPDAHLLNGPQLAGNALSQDAIDDLFGSIGEANHG